MPMTNEGKELVVLEISVTAMCRPRASHHFRQAQDARIDGREIQHTIRKTSAIRVRKIKIMGEFAIALLEGHKPVEATGGGNGR